MFKKLWNWLKPLFFEEAPAKEKKQDGHLSLFHWILIIVCLGIAAMIFHNYFSLQKEVKPTVHTVSDEEEAEEVFGSSRSSPQSMREYEEFYENKLKDILTTVKGVGEVNVFVNLDTTEEMVVEMNRRTQQSQTHETDREGGSREIEDQTSDDQVVIMRGDDGEEPVVLMHRKPRVRGVMVVAGGADHAQVKAWIVEAVQRTLDVPLHRISVLPKK